MSPKTIAGFWPGGPRSVTVHSLLAAMFAAAAYAFASPSARTPDWVTGRIRAWQPTARERRWESIGWAPALGPALRLARQHDRPVFLFTYDGRIGTGRC